MNNSDQLRKLVSILYVSIPTLAALIVAYLLLICAHTTLASGAVGFAAAWFLATYTSLRYLRYIKRSE